MNRSTTEFAFKLFMHLQHIFLTFYLLEVNGLFLRFLLVFIVVTVLITL